IYAIDAVNRDVLVMNDRGVMQSVNAASANRRPDRIDFGGKATTSIEVIEPGYRDCVQDLNVGGARYLNGVFLAASTIDGTIRIADIYDLNVETLCAGAPNPPEGASTE